MRITAAIFFSLLLSSQAIGQCPTVQAINFQQSSGNVRIKVLILGKSAKDVKVDFVHLASDPAASPKRLYSFVSNENGLVIPPELEFGRYAVEAGTASGLGALLLLEVLPKSEPTPTTYSMDLEPNGASIWYSLKAAEEKPPGEVVRQFAGTVQNSQGAGLAGVKVDVWNVGSVDRSPAGEIVSGKDGLFALDLADGLYVASFRLDGFHDQIVTLEIRRDHNAAEFRVSMTKGETVYVCS